MMLHTQTVGQMLVLIILIVRQKRQRINPNGKQKVKRLALMKVMLNGSNANTDRGNGENDFLNGSGGNDTYNLGDFGNDKVFDFAGFDVYKLRQIDNVWFERLGRRG